MIGKAKSISHGINDIRYITGESRNKEHPEKITHINNYFMSNQLDTLGMWHAMQLNLTRFKPIKNSVIRIELSASKEHTMNFSIADWKQLWDDFIEEFDKQELLDKKGKLVSKKTNLANSIGTVWLHRDSEGGVPHLHGAFCRIDNDGNINNDHNIHLRAQRAAERVAKKRGWTTANEIHSANIKTVSEDCLSALKSMDTWSWNDYVKLLRCKGYEVFERRDSKNILRGYSLQLGRAKFKASELGVGRNLTASKIENTWNKLHQSEQEQQRIDSSMNDASKTAKMHEPYRSPSGVDYMQPHRDYVPYRFTIAPNKNPCFIPESVNDFFDDEFDYRFVDNCDELKDIAVAIFIGLMQPYDVPSNGGGGGQSDLPWRDKDNDDMDWARKCARLAALHAGVRPRNKRKR